MRAGLALIAAFALCVTPSVAQGKTKASAVPQSVQAKRQVCPSNGGLSPCRA